MPNKNFNDLTIATTTDGTELVPVVSSGVTSAISVSNINSGIISDTISDVTNADDLSVGQSSIAAGVSSLVSSITQQDLSGVNTVGLHRNSSAAVTSMFIYDTSKDSDGGAWTEKCQHTSWYNEPLSGKWLGAQPHELFARFAGASLGANVLANPNFDTDASGYSFLNGATLERVDGRGKMISSNGTQYATVYADFANPAGLKVNTLYEVSIDIYPGTYTGNVTFNMEGSNAVGGVITVSATTQQTLKTYMYPTASGNKAKIRFDNTHTAGQYIFIDNFRYCEVVSPTAVSNDYYQSSADGKFYRLWKNLLAYPEQFESWQFQGASVLPNATVAPNGLQTADKIIENSSLTYHYIVRSATTASLTDYTFSFYAKAGERTTCGVEIAFGASAKRGAYDLVSGVASGTGNASMENVGNGWWRCVLQYTTDASTTSSSVLIETVAVASYQGDGTSGLYLWGAQLERGTVATTYEPKGIEGSVSEVFRGNKREFPKLSAFIEESGSLTIYDLTEAGRPMWMRFDKAGSFRMPMGIGVANGTFSGYSGSSAIQIVSFCYDSVRFINYSGNYLYGNIANRNLTTFNAVLDSTTKVLSSNSRAYKTYVYATPQSTSIGGDALPNATVFNLNNTTIDVFRSNGSYVTLGRASTSNSLGLPVRIRNSDFLYLSTFDAGATKLYYLNNPELKTNNPTNLIADISTSEFGRSSFASSSSSIQKFISDGQTKFFKFVSGLPQVHTNTINLNEPVKTLSSAITNTYNTGYIAGDVRRVYLADTTAETVIGQDVISDPTFQNGIGDWTGYNATISTTGPGNLRATVVNNSSGWNVFGFTKTLTGLVVNRTYRIIFGFVTSTNQFDNGSGWNDAQGSIRINGTTIYNYGRTSEYDSFTFTASATTAELTITNGHNYYASWDLKYVYVTQAAPDRSFRGGYGTYTINAMHTPALVTGTLTKSPVAAGSQLVAYSGFSA